MLREKEASLTATKDDVIVDLEDTIAGLEKQLRAFKQKQTAANQSPEEGDFSKQQQR